MSVVLLPNIHLSYKVIMETTRQQKIARLIQKELSDIFQRQTQTMPGVLVSVSAVRISPDMSVCRGYLSVFPSERSSLLTIRSTILTILTSCSKSKTTTGNTLPLS